jgi:hypothetical protein
MSDLIPPPFSSLHRGQKWRRSGQSSRTLIFVPLVSCSHVPSVPCSLAFQNCGMRRQCAKLETGTFRDSLQSSQIPWRFAVCAVDKNGIMKRKSAHPNFEKTLDLLRSHGFEVAPYAAVAGGVLVSKHCVAAVLIPAPRVKGVDGASAALAVHPGVMVNGEVSLLLDRGYQKFIKTSQYELPATAIQLQGIHAYSEELKQLTGATSLYNESLGTTSDVYQYDRLMGREAAQPEPVQPWELTEGH